MRQTPSKESFGAYMWRVSKQDARPPRGFLSASLQQTLPSSLSHGISLLVPSCGLGRNFVQSAGAPTLSIQPGCWRPARVISKAQAHPEFDCTFCWFLKKRLQFAELKLDEVRFMQQCATRHTEHLHGGGGWARLLQQETCGKLRCKRPPVHSFRVASPVLPDRQNQETARAAGNKKPRTRHVSDSQTNM